MEVLNNYPNIQTSEESLSNFISSIPNIESKSINKEYKVNFSPTYEPIDTALPMVTEIDSVSYGESNLQSQPKTISNINTNEPISYTVDKPELNTIESINSKVSSQDSISNMDSAPSSESKRMDNENTISKDNVTQQIGNEKDTRKQSENEIDKNTPKQTENETEKETSQLQKIMNSFVPTSANRDSLKPNKEIKSKSSLPNFGGLSMPKTAKSGLKYYLPLEENIPRRLNNRIKALSVESDKTAQFVENLAKSQTGDATSILKAEKALLRHIEKIDGHFGKINTYMSKMNNTEFAMNKDLRNSGALEQINSTLKDINSTFNSDLTSGLNELGNKEISKAINDISSQSQKLKQNVDKIISSLVQSISRDKK